MSFLENAKLFIPALSGLSVIVWDEKDQTLELFEKDFCFLPAVQPLYTAKGIRKAESFPSRFRGQKKERIIENLNASEVELTEEEFCSLDEALNQCKVYGHRGLSR